MSFARAASFLFLVALALVARAQATDAPALWNFTRAAEMIDAGRRITIEYLRNHR